MIKIQEREAESEAINFQKDKVFERCQGLIDMLEIGEDDYLTHYFKSNGLPLDAPKPFKNKYSMVFE
jgi:hypothetical protein